MHIEPSILTASSVALSIATAAGAIAYAGKLVVSAVKHDSGAIALLLRTIITTILVFSFFEVLPHYPVGVSEVHFILGSTLFLLFGAAPAALGLSLGLLAQGLLFAPADLPQFGANVTTLLVPLFLMHQLAKKLIPANTAYKDISYKQALALSTCYQGGIVAWVAFWAFYGAGFGAENVSQVLSFGAAYMLVVAVEPLIDLLILATAKLGSEMTTGKLFHKRLHQA